MSDECDLEELAHAVDGVGLACVMEFKADATSGGCDEAGGEPPAPIRFRGMWEEMQVHGEPSPCNKMYLFTGNVLPTAGVARTLAVSDAVTLICSWRLAIVLMSVCFCATQSMPGRMQLMDPRTLTWDLCMIEEQSRAETSFLLERIEVLQKRLQNFERLYVGYPVVSRRHSSVVRSDVAAAFRGRDWRSWGNPSRLKSAGQQEARTCVSQQTQDDRIKLFPRIKLLSARSNRLPSPFLAPKRLEGQGGDTEDADEEFWNFDLRSELQEGSAAGARLITELMMNAYSNALFSAHDSGPVERGPSQALSRAGSRPLFGHAADGASDLAPVVGMMVDDTEVQASIMEMLTGRHNNMATFPSELRPGSNNASDNVEAADASVPLAIWQSQLDADDLSWQRAPRVPSISPRMGDWAERRADLRSETSDRANRVSFSNDSGHGDLEKIAYASRSNPGDTTSMSSGNLKFWSRVPSLKNNSFTQASPRLSSVRESDSDLGARELAVANNSESTEPADSSRKLSLRTRDIQDISFALEKQPVVDADRARRGSMVSDWIAANSSNGTSSQAGDSAGNWKDEHASTEGFAFSPQFHPHLQRVTEDGSRISDPAKSDIPLPLACAPESIALGHREPARPYGRSASLQPDGSCKDADADAAAGVLEHRSSELPAQVSSGPLNRGTSDGRSAPQSPVPSQKHASSITLNMEDAAKLQSGDHSRAASVRVSQSGAEPTYGCPPRPAGEMQSTNPLEQGRKDAAVSKV